MKPFSKKNIKAEIPERPRFMYDREPYDQAEERGKKEVSQYDEEYEFLIKLIKLISKAAPESVPEIKALSQSFPFVTIDDVGDLASKIWTLATEKYNIPRDWLIKKLDKHAKLARTDSILISLMKDAYEAILQYQLEKSPTTEQFLEKQMREKIYKVLNVLKTQLSSKKIIDLASKDYIVRNTINSLLPDIVDTLSKLDTMSVDNLGIEMSQIKQQLHYLAGSHPTFDAIMGGISSAFNSFNFEKLDMSASLKIAKKSTELGTYEKCNKCGHQGMHHSKEEVWCAMCKGPCKNNKKAYTTDLTQFALDDKQIRQHFESRGLDVADVVSSLPNFSIKYINKDLEKKDPSLKDNTNGFYDYTSGILYINPRLSVDDKRITIIHEIEHAIQDSVGMLPVHTPEDLKQVQKTPYLERTFEIGARQQQFNALKARGMSLEDIEKYWIKRYKVPEFALEEVRNELEQYNELSEEMMPGSILASKKANKTYDDEWQAQKETQDMLNHAPGYLAYDYGQDKTADDDGFKGSDFSGTDAEPNPVIDNGPFSSPQDHGAKDQKSPFPNTNWLPADDQNLDEQPASNVASTLEKPFSKKADLSGQVVNTILNDIHSSGTATYNMIDGDMQGTHNFAVSAYSERTQSSPEGVDFDVIEKYLLANGDLLKDSNNSFRAVMQNGQVQLQVVTTVPDRDQAIELAKQHNQSTISDLLSNQDISTNNTEEVKKTADENVLSQSDQDEIAAKWTPAMNILLNNYNDSVKRGHSKDRSLEYALYSIQNIDKNITEKQAVEAINTYL